MRALIPLFLMGCTPGVVHDRFNVVSGDAVLPVSVHGDLSGGTLVVWESGGPSGPGMAERSVRLIDFRDTLEQHMAIAMYDRRGVGNAHGDYDPEDITAGVLIDDLDAVGRVLDERYAPERTVLMGHSFGGLLSALYLSEGRGSYDEWVAVAPGWAGQDQEVQIDFRFAFACRVAADRVEAGDSDTFFTDVLDFCAVTTGPIEPYSAEHEQLWDYLGGISERLEPWTPMDTGALLATVLFSHYNLVDTQLRENIVSSPVWDSLEGTDILASLERVDIPTLVVTGEYDDIGNTEMATAGASRMELPATVVELEGAGHYPFTDKPADFEAAVLELLEE